MELEQVIKELRKGALPLDRFDQLTIPLYPEFEWEERLELFKLQGLPIFEKGGKIYLETALVPFRRGRFVVVDIEATNSSLEKGELLEIGAVKIEGGEVVGEFQVLVKVSHLPEFISKMTGITEEMVAEATPLKEALYQFRLFLGDATFISHPIHFDYRFLNNQFKRAGLGELLNRSLCTLKLARKVYRFEKYNLRYLQEQLGLEETPSHRGLEDARTTAQLFLKSLSQLPSSLTSVEDLIHYVCHSPKPKKRKRGEKRKATSGEAKK